MEVCVEGECWFLSCMLTSCVCVCFPGLVEIEEGKLDGHRLSLQSRALARTSFAKRPFVQQVCLVLSSKCTTFAVFFFL